MIFYLLADTNQIVPALGIITCCEQTVNISLYALIEYC